MPRFFCEEIDGEHATIRGEDARHLTRVLRARVGEPLTLCDLHGFDYDCVVAEVDADCVSLTVLKRYPNETEPSARITLYQALPKGDKLDFIVQKATELGAAEIVPVLTQHCVARADSKSFSKKRVRLQKIALEAAKQSGRGIIPTVSDILNFDQMLAEFEERGTEGPALVFYEGGGAHVDELVPAGAKSASLLIGSEGGFSEEEIARCEAVGIHAATLGRRILRCETAPIAAITLALHAAGEL